MVPSERPSQRTTSLDGDVLDGGWFDEAFHAQVAAGLSFVPLWKRWPADLETPLTTWLKVGETSRHGVLLESVEGGEQVGRYSFVGVNPRGLVSLKIILMPS